MKYSGMDGDMSREEGRETGEGEITKGLQVKGRGETERRNGRNGREEE